MIWRRLIIRSGAALFALVLVPCAFGAEESAQGSQVTVHILTTGDIHEYSQYLPRIAAYIKHMKSVHSNVIALNCGDALTDYAATDPWNGDLWRLKTRGNAMFRIMASMGYDVCIIGNHDECHGMAQLAMLMNKWKIPYMGVNLEKSPATIPFTKPYVQSFQHVSVGIVGTVSSHTNHLPRADRSAFQLNGVRGRKVTSAINAIKKNADIVILITHETDADDQQTADDIYGISVIAGGHSHTTTYEHRYKQHDKIVKSGFKGQYVSRLDLTWDYQSMAIVESHRYLVNMDTWKMDDTWTSEDAGVQALLRTPYIKKNDYDGDGKSDPAVFREADGTWAFKLSGSGYDERTLTLGGPGTVPVRGDFDGDGKSDPAVYREADGAWAIKLSGSGYGQRTLMLGGPGSVPMAGDYEGDLTTDCAVYEAASGLLTVELTDGGRVSMNIGGGPGYVPAQGYYDADALTDPVLYRDADASWSGLMSDSAYAPAAVKFGGAGRQPVPGYYDADSRVDPAVYTESSGQWTAMLSGSSYSQIPFEFGGPGCAAVPADYDGDGKEDPAVYRESDGTWGFKLSGDGYGQRTLTLGGPGSVPVR